MNTWGGEIVRGKIAEVENRTIDGCCWCPCRTNLVVQNKRLLY